VIKLPQLGVEPTLVVDRGWETNSERNKWLEFMTRYGPGTAPTAVATYRARPYFTGVRRELVDDRTYFKSNYYEYRESIGLEDEIVSLFVGPGGNYQILVLNRYRSAGTWRERDARILDLLHREIVSMLGNGLATANEWMAGPLSPRLRQTMELLLDGLSEKQIAGRLQLSEYTVHEYVQKLYRRYGVHSRAELMSAWVPGRRLMQTTRGEDAP
jgi:DNA-binding CsgD family transcriptional regulator